MENRKTIVKAKEVEGTNYNSLISIGDSISKVCIILGIIMIIGIFISAMNDGPIFLLIISAIVTFITGFAIKYLFFCVAGIAKNSEKQTELLERLNEKLDK